MKKIMFNDKYGLTQAVLEREKTQTRRIINGVDKLSFYDFGIDDKGKQYATFYAVATTKDVYFPYQVGEVVAIAQSYKDCGYDENDFLPTKEKPSRVKYYAGWSNKMFVKAELMPHHIKITNVRVEKLPYISEKDCIAEGIEKGDFTNTRDTFFFREGQNYITGRTAWIAYSKLIDKVCKKGTWDSNPWVFVYEFELID